MNTDALRELIWEQLYQAKVTKSIDQIAALANCDTTAVRVAVNHEWFAVTERGVSIAYAAPSINVHR